MIYHFNNKIQKYYHAAKLKLDGLNSSSAYLKESGRFRDSGAG
jgi:hypothetical protein